MKAVMCAAILFPALCLQSLPRWYSTLLFSFSFLFFTRDKCRLGQGVRERTALERRDSITFLLRITNPSQVLLPSTANLVLMCVCGHKWVRQRSCATEGTPNKQNSVQTSMGELTGDEQRKRGKSESENRLD